MMAAAYGIVVFLAASISVSVVQLAATLPDYAPRADELTADVENWLSDKGLSADPTQTALSNLDLGKVTGLLTDVLGSLLGVLSGFFFLATVLFFVTVDAASVHARAALLHTSRPAVVDALREFSRATQKYLLMTTIFGGIVAVLDTIALWLLGVPLPVLWGLLAFVTNFIPNIGFVIGLVPPALLALLDGGWKAAVAVLIVYCVLNVVIQTFIQPRFVGDAVGLNPTVTFLSLALWTLLLGPLGALLAVPATLLVRAILIDADPAAHWARLLIGSTPSTPSPDRSKPVSKKPATPTRTRS
jgi:predicted PurR-regulated permease PerM